MALREVQPFRQGLGIAFSTVTIPSCLYCLYVTAGAPSKPLQRFVTSVGLFAVNDLLPEVMIRQDVHSSAGEFSDRGTCNTHGSSYIALITSLQSHTATSPPFDTTRPQLLRASCDMTQYGNIWTCPLLARKPLFFKYCN